MNSTAALITLTHNVFQHVAVDGGEGLYSPRTGREAVRETGYVVGGGKIGKINPGLTQAQQFSAIVEFIAAEPQAGLWATANPLYLSAGHDEDGGIILSWDHVVNDRAEAIRIALANGDPFIGDIGNDSLIEIQFPSAAAQQFLQEVMQLETRYAASPSGELLHDIPGLHTNPWDTDYNRSHL